MQLDPDEVFVIFLERLGVRVDSLYKMVKDSTGYLSSLSALSPCTVEHMVDTEVYRSLETTIQRAKAKIIEIEKVCAQIRTEAVSGTLDNKREDDLG